MRTLLIVFLTQLLFFSCGEEPAPLVKLDPPLDLSNSGGDSGNGGGQDDYGIPTPGLGSSSSTVISWREADDAGHVTLISTRDYAPPSWEDGLYFLSQPLKIYLPHQIFVTSGRAGSQYFFIELQTSVNQGILPQQIRCFYRGIGTDKYADFETEDNKDYFFSFCMDAAQSFSIKTVDKFKDSSFNLLIEPGVHRNPIYMEVGDNIKGHIDNANYRSSPRERVPTSTETKIDLEKK